MLATRLHSLARFPEVVRGMIALLLCASGLSLTLCNAQGSLPCGHSTVEDAWGPVFGSQARLFLAELQRAVQRRDKDSFGRLVHYPVLVLDGNERSEISTAANLTQRYSKIMTPDLKSAILSQTPNCLFANSQGVMIGVGQVWFQQQPDGKMRIITINITSVGGHDPGHSNKPQ